MIRRKFRGLKNRGGVMLGSGYRYLNWHAIGKSRYLSQEPLLKRPAQDGHDRFVDSRKIEFYENGITICSQEEYIELAQRILPSVREEFAEAIQHFEAGIITRKVDSQGRFWYINTESGVIRLTYADLNHPSLAEYFRPEIYGRATGSDLGATDHSIENLYQKYPEIKNLVEDPALSQVALLANDNDPNPLLIQFERKTHTTGDANNYIHYDIREGAFKAYLYLTDVVDELSGPIAVSKGSHHWAQYPRLLRDIGAKGKQQFSNRDVEPYGIQPFMPMLGNTGLLFCFSGNSIHKATDVAIGQERWSLHLYYHTPKEWSTDASRA